mmetsp:Transcript_22665/g.41087  ORF Transcript_22665/g.41087 Transcript_22665/m.41087 type:complete len:88 (+) Transcript_22665:175-438(+)
MAQKKSMGPQVWHTENALASLIWQPGRACRICIGIHGYFLWHVNRSLNPDSCKLMQVNIYPRKILDPKMEISDAKLEIFDANFWTPR